MNTLLFVRNFRRFSFLEITNDKALKGMIEMFRENCRLQDMAENQEDYSIAFCQKHIYPARRENTLSPLE